jgi:hypothetical protein
MRIQFLESEIQQLKQANQHHSNEKLENQKQIQNLTLQLNEKTKQLASLSKTNDEKERLLAIATSIFNNYATAEHISSLNVTQRDEHNGTSMVQLVVHQSYTISLHAKQQLVALSYDQKVNSSAIFRELMRNIINDIYVLGANNAKTLMQTYPVLKACQGFFFFLI